MEAQQAQKIRSSPDRAHALPLVVSSSETVSSCFFKKLSPQVMRAQKLRASGCNSQPPLRKREPRTQLRCFDTYEAILSMSSDATGKIFLRAESGLINRPSDLSCHP